MPNPTENGPSRADLRRSRIRRARIVTTVLTVVATVVLGVVLATSDPTRADSSTPAATHVSRTPATPDAGTDNGYTPGNDDGGFSRNNGGGGVPSSGPDTQTHGS